MALQKKWLYAFLLLCWVGVHCGIYKSFYNVSNIPYLNSLPPPTTLLYSPYLPGIVSTGIIFVFAYMYTQYLYHSHPPTPFPCHLPPPTGTTPPSCSLIL
jgi:hypothetical protein